MNSTIKQMSRPAKEQQLPKGLPPEAKKFAKQMGLDLKGLEAEAEDMWNMLNSMSVERPHEYEQFIAEQLKKGKQTEDSGKEEGGKMFRPKSGFCIKCITTGNDGIKVRDFGSKQGKDLYINFCSHEAIEPPKDRNGRPALDERISADGMEIPLVVGPARNVDEGTIAVDVVLHPVLIARCDSHRVFCSQVIDLALEWVGKESKILFNPRYERVSGKSYVGGRGEDKSTPVLLSVDEILSKQEADPRSDTTDDSKALLNSLKQSREQKEPSADVELRMPTNVSKKSVVEEVNEPTQSATRTRKQPSKKKPAIKKGFLNDAAAKNVELYPEGSNEGTGSAEGGTYARFMSKCQVVDTATMPQPQTTLPPPSIQQTKVSATKSTLSSEELKEIDELFSGVDDDFATQTDLDRKKKIQHDQEVSATLSQLAGVLGGSQTASALQPPDSNQINTLEKSSRPSPELYHIDSPLPAALPVTIEVTSYVEGSRSIYLRVSDVDRTQLKVADLQVSDRSVIISIPDKVDEGNNEQLQGTGGVLKLALKFCCDTKTVSASMSKKRRRLKFS